jgi:hypothetical protein
MIQEASLFGQAGRFDFYERLLLVIDTGSIFQSWLTFASLIVE